MKEIKIRRKPELKYCSCPNCGKDMGKTYDENEKYLPDCPICGTKIGFSQNKKFEKVEKMAWNMYQYSLHPEEEINKNLIDACFKHAKEFCKRAEQKREE